jgi:hypothetical protein
LISRPEIGHTTLYADGIAAFDFVLDKAGINRQATPPAPK